MIEQVTISLETGLKFQIEETLANFGLTWSELLKEAIHGYRPVTEEMRLAMEECEDIIANPKKHKFYTDLDELFHDLDRACEDDEL